MTDHPRWDIAVSACEVEGCQDASCRAWQRSRQFCFGCGKAIDGDLPFAYRTDGSRAMHPSCLYEQLAGPRQVMNLPDVVYQGGEFQVRIPKTQREAEELVWHVEAAERFRASALTALRLWGGGSVVPLPDRPVSAGVPLRSLIREL